MWAPVCDLEITAERARRLLPARLDYRCRSVLRVVARSLLASRIAGSPRDEYAMEVETP
jgi:hypothetical protein